MLMRMPIVVDTLGLRQKKSWLEAQLRDLEARPHGRPAPEAPPTQKTLTGLAARGAKRLFLYSTTAPWPCAEQLIPVSSRVL